jgi:ribonuclease Z
MHADHVSGMLGMMLAFKQAQRTNPVTIVGPVGIKKYVETFLMITSKFGYPVNFVELKKGENNLNIRTGLKNDVVIKSVPALHSKPCFAYSIDLERKPKFIREKVEEIGIPVQFWKALSQGQDIVYQNKVYKGSDFISKPRKGLKISYVTDTRPMPHFRDFIKNSDIAVIEGMYRDKDKMDKAKSEKHMLWDESVSLAKDNGIGEVILTHFSPSLQIEPNDANLLKSKLSNAVLGRDGLYRHLKYDDEIVALKEKVEPPIKAEKVVKPQKDKTKDANYRMEIVKKYYKRMSMTSMLEKIEPITSFKYRVHMVGGVTHTVFVYKSIQSMKEDYQNMLPVDDFFVFFQ